MTPAIIDRIVGPHALVCDEAGAAALTTVLLMPDGQVKSSSGDFVVDPDSFAEMATEFKRRGIDIVIDYEHQTLTEYNSRPDGQAPAAGWIKKLHYEKGRGVVATVEWNAEASEAIRGKRYKYLSPVVRVRKSDNKAIALHSAALTNTPAIERMEALAAKARQSGTRQAGMEQPGKETTMPSTMLKVLEDPAAAGSAEEKLTALRKMLGLAEEAGAVQILAAAVVALERMKGDNAVANSVRSRLNLPAEATVDAVVVALAHRLGTDTELTVLRERLATIERTDKERKRDTLIEDAVKANKINPHDKEAFAAAQKLALESPEQFALVLKGIIPAVSGGRTTPPATTTTGTSHEETLIAHAMKEHNNHFVKAMTALQKRLINERLESSGLRREIVAEQLVKEFPKIFG